MAYKALYRTYRPSTFEEVAGQQHIVKTLKNALETNKISHAYLFCGPRGTGKTSMAKLFAKALNCDEGIGSQCNECKNCKAILDGSHPDVLEIDAASNRGINEIKDLIEKVKYSTILGRYKVYIIDEVHMMTTEAFNALLKTLEEPPEHVIFILATTEPYKLLPTILSRCQRYDFTRLSDNDITDRLITVLKNENIQYSEEAIRIIVELADGGMRDALSMLDQVLAYSGNTLNEKDVLDIFSLESKREKLDLIKSIAQNNVGDILQRLNTYISKGSDIKRLTNDIVKILKDVLVFASSTNSKLLENISDKEAVEINSYLSNKTLIQMIDILMATIKEYKFVSDINTTFEITLLKLANLNDKKAAIPQNNNVSVTPNEHIEQPSPVINTTLKEKIKTEQEIKIEQPMVSDDFISSVDTVISLKNIEDNGNYKIQEKQMIDIMVSSKKNIKNEILEKWANIKKYNAHAVYGKIATILSDGYPLVASNKILIIELPVSNLVEKANLIENQQTIQTIINTIFNKHMFVYAVSRSQSVDYQKTYRNLLEINKLPKPEAVTLEFEEK